MSSWMQIARGQLPRKGSAWGESRWCCTRAASPVIAKEWERVKISRYNMHWLRKRCCLPDLMERPLNINITEAVVKFFDTIVYVVVYILKIFLLKSSI